MITGKKQKPPLEELVYRAREGKATREDVARINHLFNVGGRRVERFLRRANEQWLVQPEQPNRKARRAAGLRSTNHREVIAALRSMEKS